MSNSATYIADDTTTKGNWIGVYGADGWRIAQYLVPNTSSNINNNGAYEDTTNTPGYASITLSGNNTYVWDDDVNGDPRKVTRPSGLDPLASCWYTNSDPWTMVINVGSTPRYVTFYLMDYDGSGTRETGITASDADTIATLVTQRNYTGSGYSNGIWVRYMITGNVRFDFANIGDINAVVTMVAFDPTTTTAKYYGGQLFW